MLMWHPTGEHQAARPALLGSALGLPGSRELACAVCMWGAYADTACWELSGVRGARAGAATNLLNVECFHLKDQVFNRPPGDFRRRKLLKVTENCRGIEPGPGEAPTITELLYK